MMNVSDLSKYIINFCNEHNYNDCSNKKLQKLLYYCQAWSLAIRNKIIFDDKIEAWMHGPVVKEIYFQYKDNSYYPIKINEHIEISCKEDKDIIDKVLSLYARYSADMLEYQTHIEDPWINACKNENDNTITNESMRDFYSNLIQKIPYNNVF